MLSAIHEACLPAGLGASRAVKTEPSARACARLALAIFVWLRCTSALRWTFLRDAEEDFHRRLCFGTAG